jgi:hypothetical protein
MAPARKLARLFIAAHVCLITVFLYSRARWPLASVDMRLFNASYAVPRARFLLVTAVSFAIIGTLYIAFVLLAGRPLDRSLGLWHFGLTLAGALLLLPFAFGSAGSWALLSGGSLIAAGQTVFIGNVISSIFNRGTSDMAARES